MTVNDLNHIQIVVDLSVIRIYYVEKMFYSCLVNHEAITPKMFKKAYQVRDYLMDELQNKKNIDLRYFFRTDLDINKKIKILDMNGYYSELDVIYKALLLLIE